MYNIKIYLKILCIQNLILYLNIIFEIKNFYKNVLLK